MKSLQTRATGASCKECRRLKIKCDKQVPCGTCSRRGLQSLCPDGQLSGTKGSRYVLASAEESWHRIQALCVRVQDLEFALDRAHSLVSNEKHPLLDPELVKIGQDPRAVKPESTASPTKAADDVQVSNYGTMKISKSGSFRWLGTTAFPLLMLDDFDQESESRTRPGDGVVKAEQSPGATAILDAKPISELKSAAIRLLPPRLEALRLIDVYFDFCWRWPLIMCRATVIDSLFTPAYDGDGSTLSTYNLSALYSILALGTLFDTSLDPNCQEFKTRRYWSRKLFYLQWPHSPSTIEKLEALVLLFRVSWPFFDEAYAENYEMIAWGIKICEKIGLHRDPANLNLSAEECLRRRRVFWAMWYHDSVTSLVHGQPPTLAKAFVDCQPPQETTESPDDIHVQLLLTLQDLLSHFFECSQPGSYDTALRIDQKIRHIDLDSCTTYMRSIVSSCGGNITPASVELMNGYVRGLRYCLMMALHKPYFCLAATKSAQDPFRGKYRLSVETIYESATGILEIAHSVTRHMRGLHAGVVPTWVHYHSAVLALYGFAVYLPYASQATGAMKTADLAVSGIFQPYVNESDQAATSLPSILQCQAAAHASMAAYQAGTWAHPSQKPAALATPTDAKNIMHLFFNENFIVAGAQRISNTRTSISHSHHSSLSDTRDDPIGNPSENSRKGSPCDVFQPPSSAASMYDYGGEHGFSRYTSGDTGDNHPTYRTGSNSSGSSVIVSHTESNPIYWSGTNQVQSPPPQHPPRDPNADMEWTDSPVPVHTKVESPPHQGIVWPGQTAYVQQVGAPSLVIPTTPHLQPNQHTLEDYASHGGTIRRVRGLSRARSFPSDYPPPHTGFSPIVTAPSATSLSQQHPQTVLYQPMIQPPHYLSPTTPASAQGSLVANIPPPVHTQVSVVQGVDHVHPPLVDAAHPHPRSHSHPYPQEQSSQYPRDERQWSAVSYRPGYPN